MGKRQRRQCTLRGGPVEADRIRERELRIEPAEHEAGVGHRRLGSAPSVARGARLRAGTPWPHTECATFVHRRDTSPAGTHRFDEDGRKRERHPRDRFGAFRQGDAAADQARIGTRAAHIEREKIVGLDGSTDQSRAYDTAGRTGQRQTCRPGRRLLGRHGPSAGRHDPQRHHTASLGQHRGLPQIRRHVRPQVRLGGGRARALVFAEHR